MENQLKKPLFFYGEKTVEYRGTKQVRRVTIAAIEDNGVLRIGSATCSEKDRFIKEKGRNLATGRAKSKTPDDMLKLVEGEKIPQQFVAYCKNIEGLVAKPKKIKANKPEADLEIA